MAVQIASMFTSSAATNGMRATAARATAALRALAMLPITHSVARRWPRRRAPAAVNVVSVASATAAAWRPAHTPCRDAAGTGAAVATRVIRRRTAGSPHSSSPQRVLLVDSAAAEAPHEQRAVSEEPEPAARPGAGDSTPEQRLCMTLPCLPAAGEGVAAQRPRPQTLRSTLPSGHVRDMREHGTRSHSDAAPTLHGCSFALWCAHAFTQCLRACTCCAPC